MGGWVLGGSGARGKQRARGGRVMGNFNHICASRDLKSLPRPPRPPQPVPLLDPLSIP